MSTNSIIEDRDTWKQRALLAEDLIERNQIWEEVLPRHERLSKVCEEVMRIRGQFPGFCAELWPAPPES